MFCSRTGDLRLWRVRYKICSPVGAWAAERVAILWASGVASSYFGFPSVGGSV